MNKTPPSEIMEWKVLVIFDVAGHGDSAQRSQVIFVIVSYRHQ